MKPYSTVMKKTVDTKNTTLNDFFCDFMYTQNPNTHYCKINTLCYDEITFRFRVIMRIVIDTEIESYLSSFISTDRILILGECYV